MVAKKRVTKVVDNRKPTHSLDAARPSKGGKGRDAATVSFFMWKDGAGAAARADVREGKGRGGWRGEHVRRLPTGVQARSCDDWGTYTSMMGGRGKHLLKARRTQKKGGLALPF